MWPFRSKSDAPVLLQVLPSRWDDDPIRRATALFRGLVGLDACSLEFAASAKGIRFYVRAGTRETLLTVRSQLRANYPQAELREVPVAADLRLDPAHPSATGVMEAAEVRLRHSWVLPLATEWPDGDDPLASILAAAAQLEDGEEVLCQVALSPAPERWGEQVQAMLGPTAAEPARRADNTASGGEMVPLVALFAVGAALFQGYLWLQAGKVMLVAAVAGASLPLLALAAALAAWWQSGRSGPTRQVAGEKLAEPALAVQIRVIASGHAASSRKRLRSIARQVASSYRVLEHPSGNSVRPASWSGDPRLPQVQLPLFRSVAILNAAELAGFWHLPCDGAGLLSPAGVARHLLPDAEDVARGCPVGVSAHQGTAIDVHMP